MRLKLVSLLVVVLSGLSACSTTQKSTQPQQQASVSTANAITALNAEGLWQKAQTSAGAKQFQLLYAARDAALQERNWILLEQVAEHLGNTAQVDQIQNKLYIALARQQQGQFSNALSMLGDIESQLSSPAHQAWHQYLSGSIYASQDLPKKALPYFFAAADLCAEHQLSIVGLNDEIWQALQQLSSYALERFDRGSTLQQGWVKLAMYQQIYVGKGSLLEQALNNWQRRFVNHPAQSIVPEQVQQTVTLEPYTSQRLAILLPQSGANERLGAALKNGALAALDGYAIEQVFFIDEMLPATEIAQQLASKQIDFVIGPLLKANINKLTELDALAATPALMLNTPDIVTVKPDQFYFALNPEHEVEQALVHFLTAGYKKPMLLAPQNINGERLVEKFTTEWQKYSATTAEIGFYTDSKNMADIVAQLLEVDSSKARIRDIKSLFRTEVESETRSRADIDVIYILGDTVETRLLKPYLDVNVSTFAKRIPLFATSRSYSKRIDTTDKSDLEGLHFTEQPWMLPEPDQRQLRVDYDNLWPEQADIEQRLFAMAFDAIRLIPELKQLAAIPGKEFHGLTGKLKVKEQHMVWRRLSWARYHSKSIERVELAETAPTPLFMQPQTDSVTLVGNTR
ncbi:penicillin-binding protein activator [Pseudoalteromonas fenneropenaei]|uniref:Penicillin-binding protein activator n=1 Tax=Pseudoalteromonas fenneropenaei TaxID=1737459 RepID=A0ABV7CK98_9GAMM